MNDIHKQLLKEAKREGILVMTQQIKERNKESESSSNSGSEEESGSSKSRGGDDTVNQENTFDDDGSPRIDKECTAIEKLKTDISTLNGQNKINSDSSSVFTQQVNNLVNKMQIGDNERTSLDFDF